MGINVGPTVENIVNKKLAQSEEETKKKRRKAGFVDLLRYATYTDYVMLFGALFLTVVHGASMPFASIVFKGITDTLIKGQADWSKNELNIELFSHDILHYCALYLFLGVFSFVASFGSMACAFTCCERQLHNLRKKFFRALLRQDMEYYDANSTGSLTDRMSLGIEKIKSGAGDKLCFVVSSCACAVSGVTIAFILCWQMTLVMLIVAPIMLVTFYISGKMLTRATEQEAECRRDASGIASEVLAGIKTVMSFNAQPFEIKRYEKQIEAAKQMGIRKAIVNAAFTSTPLFLMFASMSVSFWYGSYLMHLGIVTPGTVFGVFWSVLLGVMCLAQCAPQLNVILNARMATEDIFSIIDRVPPIDCMNPNGLTLENVKGKIEFNQIHFAYPTRPDVKILQGVSYTVEPEETVALVGHSGCGKSTMVGLLLRYYEQQMGIVSIDGVPIRELNINWLRNTIGVVQQEPVIFSNTVEYNIRLGADDMTDQDVTFACQQANAHEFIMELPEIRCNSQMGEEAYRHLVKHTTQSRKFSRLLGYNTMIGEGNVQLSGGQKQRIAIARALVRKPRILLLDEATSALDTESEKVVQKALDKARAGRTTICIAHRLCTVRNADRIIVFDQGNIAEMGNHDELMEKNGIYANLVRSQEVEKSREQTQEDDVEPESIYRSTLESTEKPNLEKEQHRISEKLRRSMVSERSIGHEFEFEEAREKLEEEGGREASLLDILSYAKPELPMACVALFFTLLRGLTWPVFALIYGHLFLILSRTDDGNQMHEVLLTSVYFISLAVVSGASTFFSGSLFGICGERLSMRLGLNVYSNLLRQDPAYFDDPKHNIGTLTSRLSADGPNVQAAIDQRLAEVLQGVVSLISGILVAFVIGWNMAPIGLVTAGILVFAQGAIGQYLKWRGMKDVNLANEASRILTESVLNVKTVQALTRERQMYAAFSEASELPHKRAVQRGCLQAVSFAVSSAFINVNFAIAYAYGLLLVKNGWASPYVVFQVIEALNMASVSVMAAATYFPEYVRARISAGVMFKTINEKAKIDGMCDLGTEPDIRGDLSFRDVFFSYPARSRQLILKDATIHAKFGQTVALVGPSGSGKSTLIQLAERFYDALAGHVMIDEHDVRDLNIRYLRDHVALVGQEPTLFNLSVRDNITYGLEDVPTDKVVHAARLANIHTFVDQLPEGYNTLVGQRGGRLSGGQKQRIAIARAIVRDPKILLLDEATSALDSESEKVVQRSLDNARIGRTCLVIAHRLSTIQNADLIVVFKNGRVLEKGTHQSLLARRGLYYKLVEKQG